MDLLWDMQKVETMKNCKVRIVGPEALAKQIKDEILVHFHTGLKTRTFPRFPPRYAKDPHTPDGVTIYMTIKEAVKKNES